MTPLPPMGNNKLSVKLKNPDRIIGVTPSSRIILKNPPGGPDGVTAGWRFRLTSTTFEMPYRPVSWAVSQRLFKWNINLPRGIPIPPTEMTILHPQHTIDGQTRLEISARCAMRNRRAFGYVADIQDGKCDNADTPSTLTVVV